MSEEKPVDLGAEPGMLATLLHRPLPGLGLGREGAPLSALQMGRKQINK